MAAIHAGHLLCLYAGKHPITDHRSRVFGVGGPDPPRVPTTEGCRSPVALAGCTTSTVDSGSSRRSALHMEEEAADGILGSEGVHDTGTEAGHCGPGFHRRWADHPWR